MQKQGKQPIACSMQFWIHNPSSYDDEMPYYILKPLRIKQKRDIKITSFKHANNDFKSLLQDVRGDIGTACLPQQEKKALTHLFCSSLLVRNSSEAISKQEH